MIYGTRHSPGMAFIEFARDFFESLALGSFQSALGKLDASDHRWSKALLQSELRQVPGDRKICSAAGFLDSAEPELIPLNDGHYQLMHRLPVDGKWSTAKARFEFVAKHHGNQFSVHLRGFET